MFRWVCAAVLLCLSLHAGHAGTNTVQPEREAAARQKASAKKPSPVVQKKPSPDAPKQSSSNRFEVTGVASNDTLALRAAPGWRSKRLRNIAPTANRVIGLGPRTRLNGHAWLAVEFEGTKGWVNGTYLRPYRGLENKALSKVLDCQGTEPFWSLRIERTQMLMRDSNQSTRFWKPDRAASPLDTGGWLLTGAPVSQSARPDGRLEGRVKETGACSDGMSDFYYRYELLLKLEGETLRGCCNRIPQRLSGL